MDVFSVQTVLGASVSKDKHIMKYDLEYDWVFGDQPQINKIVLRWLFEGNDFTGVGGKYDDFEKDFPNLYEVLVDEVEAGMGKASAHAKAMIQRGKDADHVLISVTMGELWVSFSKFREVKQVKPTDPSKVGTSLFKAMIAKEKPGSPVPLTVGLSL